MFVFWRSAAQRARRRLARQLRSALRREKQTWAIDPLLIAARQELIEQLVGVRACASCLRCGEKLSARRPSPPSQFSGGRCCYLDTRRLFDDQELALLAAADCAPTTLRAVDRQPEDAGCIFRGEAGCTLPATSRPTACLMYICDELGAELAAADRSAAIDRALDAISGRRARMFGPKVRLRAEPITP
ncbi:MAG: hypothetical protein H6707_19870 [Deltaproteobacteria bacterium]|nr:hypothetical protein [Deltaproteobacteria bacterium]